MNTGSGGPAIGANERLAIRSGETNRGYAVSLDVLQRSRRQRTPHDASAANS